MSLEDFNLHEWNKEIFDEYVAQKREQVAMEQGSEEALIKIIKEMIKNDASIEFISKVTNKSKEEILEIEESVKEEM